MTFGQAITLGAIQGLTEFLPISSSAHLYVVPTLLGWEYAGLAFDVALHIGTLLALLIAFGGQWIRLARDAFTPAPVPRRAAWELIAKLAVASVPAAGLGLVLHGIDNAMLRSLPLQAVTLSVFGILLWWVDRVQPVGRDPEVPDWRTCVFMGIAQSLALVPGVSRSGITMTAGRAAGVSRVAAARFSFLVGTPITLGAALVEVRNLSPELPVGVLIVGVASSAVVGLLAIRGLIRWVGRIGFGGFCIYRLALAALVLTQLGRG